MVTAPVRSDILVLLHWSLLPASACLSCPAPSSHIPSVLVALGATVCHALHPFAQTALLTNVHCNAPLVWFELSVVCYTINTRSSSRLLLGILLLSRVIEILWLWFCKMGPFTCSATHRWGRFGWMWTSVVAELVSLSLCCATPSLAMSGASSPVASGGLGQLSTALNMALGNSPDYGHLHGLWR